MKWLISKTKSLWNLKLALVLCCMLVGCSRSHTEKVTLPGGEIVINESTPAEWRSAAHNKIFFQRNSSSPREEVGDAWDLEVTAPISLSNPRPQVFTDGEHVTLAFEFYVFQRRSEKNGAFWFRQDTKPDYNASSFIRSLLPAGNPLLSNAGSGRLYVPYVFERFEAKQNVLVTRCADANPAWPRFLIYSAVSYGSPWDFDLARTRKANSP